MIAFIDDHREAHGVDPLHQHGKLHRQQVDGEQERHRGGKGDHRADEGGGFCGTQENVGQVREPELARDEEAEEERVADADRRAFGGGEDPGDDAADDDDGHQEDDEAAPQLAQDGGQGHRVARQWIVPFHAMSQHRSMKAAKRINPGTTPDMNMPPTETLDPAMKA